MQVIVALITVIVGLALTALLYWGVHTLVNKYTQGKWQLRLLPYVFIGPVLVLISGFLIYPTVRTIYLSFTTLEGGKDVWVGTRNYEELLGSPDFIEILVNNLLWIAIVPILSVVIGLLVATLANNVGPRAEKTFKSLIFMPMAISFVAAATIWRFMYSYEPEGQTQTGLLNAIWVGLGGAPQPWLTLASWNFNDLLIMVPVVWLNVGFCMVLLSSAIKGVSEETIEAGKCDGANGRQVFFRIILPQMKGTVLAVFITILIGVMKIFDIVYAMTSGDFGTSVLGMEFYNQYYNFFNPGRASAVVVILFVAILPVMFYQVRVFRKQQEIS